MLTFHTRGDLYTHLDGLLGRPMTALVDVPDEEALDELLDHYRLALTCVAARAGCPGGDSLPSYDKLVGILPSSGDVVLVRLERAWLLLGERAFREGVEQWLQRPPRQGLTLIATVGVADLARPNDPRLDERRLLMRLDEGTPRRPRLTTLREGGPEGLSHFFDRHPADRLRTSLPLARFAETLIEVRQAPDDFERLMGTHPMWANKLTRDMGTPEQWRELLANEPPLTSLNDLRGQWKGADDNGRWRLFIGLLLGNDRPDYLSGATSPDDLTQRLVSRAPDGERRALIEACLNPDDLARWMPDHVKRLDLDDKKSLAKLTDLSEAEQRALLALLTKHHYSMEELQGASPRLAHYLGRDEGDVLGHYSHLYRRAKLAGRITEELREELHTATGAAQRLPARELALNQIETDGEKDAAIFVDALGMEFIPYICARSRDLGLTCEATLTRARTPTITSVNSDNIDTWLTARGLPHPHDTNELDLLKHKAKGANFEEDPSVWYLFRELAVIDGVLKDAIHMLRPPVERVLIVSDHGATRMPLLNKAEQITLAVEADGEHSGRCAPCDPPSNNDPQVARADEEGWCCLTTWDRLKGGRATQVEAHGGSTPEELCAPLIELRRNTQQAQVQWPDKVDISGSQDHPRATLTLAVTNAPAHLRLRCGDQTFEPKRSGPDSCAFDMGPALAKKKGDEIALDLTLTDAEGNALGERRVTFRRTFETELL